MTDPHYSGTPSGPIPRSRVVPNGKPGDYEIHWGPVEKALATAMIALLGGLALTGIVGGVALFREVGEIKAAQQASASVAAEAAAAATKAAAELHEHVRYSHEEHMKFVTREELRAKGR